MSRRGMQWHAVAYNWHAPVALAPARRPEPLPSLMYVSAAIFNNSLVCVLSRTMSHTMQHALGYVAGGAYVILCRMCTAW